MSGETRFSIDGSSRNPSGETRVFERSTWLATSVEAAFAFHENPRNLEKISPPSLRVIRIEAASTARVGERFRIVARQFGLLPIDWEGEWLVVEPPNAGRARVIDGAVRAPFARFDHEHRFEREGDGTRMTDRVTYALLGPRWGLIDAIANRVVGWLVLGPMFQMRHRTTRGWFARNPR